MVAYESESDRLAWWRGTKKAIGSLGGEAKSLCTENESDRIAGWRSEIAVHTMSESAPAASPNRCVSLDDDNDATVRLTTPS